jgi:hypothetical protein
VFPSADVVAKTETALETEASSFRASPEHVSVESSSSRAPGRAASSGGARSVASRRASPSSKDARGWRVSTTARRAIRRRRATRAPTPRASMRVDDGSAKGGAGLARGVAARHRTSRAGPRAASARAGAAKDARAAQNAAVAIVAGPSLAGRFRATRVRGMCRRVERPSAAFSRRRKAILWLPRVPSGKVASLLSRQRAAARRLTRLARFFR